MTASDAMSAYPGLVTDVLTAFPADGYIARWRTWDHEHVETLTLRWENEGWTATGDVGREAVTYVVRLSATWQIRQFLLFRDLDQPDLWLGNDGAGGWGEMNGARRLDLAGCTDLHLPCTPFSWSLPIRRLQLDVGRSADVVLAHVDVETLGVTRATVRYERAGPRRFVIDGDLIDSTAGGGPLAIDVDEYGLVHDVVDEFRRT